MQKLLMVLVLSVGLFGTAYAYGGFNDGGSSLATVKDALRKADNSYVTLQGNITKRITSDEYLFQDATGTIQVEIDDEEWMGQVVNAQNVIEITGEIDKEFTRTKVDVNTVKIIK